MIKIKYKNGLSLIMYKIRKKLRYKLNQMVFQYYQFIIKMIKKMMIYKMVVKIVKIVKIYKNIVTLKI